MGLITEGVFMPAFSWLRNNDKGIDFPITSAVDHSMGLRDSNRVLV